MSVTEKKRILLEQQLQFGYQFQTLWMAEINTP